MQFSAVTAFGPFLITLFSFFSSPYQAVAEVSSSYKTTFTPYATITRYGIKRENFSGSPLSIKVEGINKSSVSEHFYRHWSNSYETHSKRVLAFIPRLLGRPLYYLFFGKVSQCLIGSLENIYRLASRQVPHLDLGDTLLNPFATLSHVISDVKSVITSPLYAHKQLSSRIKMCTHNLAKNINNIAAHLFCPSEHVLLSIDGGSYQTLLGGFTDIVPEEELLCMPSIKMRNESDSLAIERLRCVHQSPFNWGYDLLNFNCGTYCRKSLGMASLANPSLTNFGIGDGLNSTPDKLRNVEREIKGYCDEKISILQSLLFKLERWQELTAAELGFITAYEQRPENEVKFAPDTVLQMLLSVAKDSGSDNRWLLQGKLQNLSARFSIYSAGRKKGVKKVYRKMLEKMFRDISGDESARRWLQQYYPEVLELQNRVNA
jgi:hypothetical protein